MPRRLASVVLVVAALAAAEVRADAPPFDPRIEAAIAVFWQDGAERAMPMFQKLATELGPNAPARDRAAVHHYIGQSHWRLGEFGPAHAELERALTIERSSGDRLGEGKTLNIMGLLAWDEGHYDQAIANFKAAGSIARTLGDPKLEGASLNNLSLVYDEQGDYDTSLEQYRRVLEIYRGADFPRGVGDTLGNIGGVYLLLGHFREALGYYQQALKISEQLKSVASQGQDHGNIALCLAGLGDTEGAIQHFDAAIAFAKQAGMKQDQAYWTREKGNSFIRKGLYDQGLTSHRAALAVYEGLGAQAELEEALNDMGHLHLLLGDPDSAEKYFTRALELARSTGLARGITSNLIALGDIEYRRGRLDAAAGDYATARDRAAQAKAQYPLAESLLRLALVHREQQNLTAAAVEVDQALAIARDIGARPLEAEALLARADVDRRRDHWADALKGFDAAQAIAAPLGDPDLLWQIHYGRARTQEAQGNMQAAIASLKSAVTVIESVRDRLQEPRFRAGYVEDKYQVYIDLVRLELAAGRTADAFSTTERLRARAFAEQMGGRPANPLSLDERRRETELRERVRQLRDAIGEQDDEGKPAHAERARGVFSRELEQAEREYQAFLDDHAAGPALAGPRGPPRTDTVRSKLHDDEALVEYLVGPEHLMTFVVTKRAVTASTIALRRVDLESRISLLRDLIRHPENDRWTKPAARLARDVIGPLEQGGALEGIRRLYVVPYGALNYLPFALLPSSSSPATLLVDRYTVEYLPTAVVLLRSGARAGEAASLLAVAPTRGGLRFAPAEARTVSALYSPHARLLLGAGATEGEFKKLAGDYTVLHLATHGHFNKLNPMLSGLELEPDRNEDGLLQVHEILDLRLSARLVTLSACDTALGSGYFTPTPAGDEFVGMTRAFLTAGSANVMATLWDVDDQASVRVMKRFYERLNRPDTRGDAASALAAAQREIHATVDLAHPYYWAPFVLVGANARSGEVATLAEGRPL